MSTSEIYCRFCAEQKPAEEIMDLTTAQKIRMEIVEKLSFFNVKLIDFSLKDLPETVCNPCYTSLKAAYNFFTKVKISQALLPNLFSDRSAQEDALNDNSPIVIKAEVESIFENDDFVQKSEENQDFESETLLSIYDAKEDVSWSSYPWLCKYCKATFESIDRLRGHSDKVHGMCYGFQCADCEMSTESFEEFVGHVRGHRKSLNRFCPHCNMKLENINHTSHDTTPQCDICGALFPTKISLQRHLSQRKSMQISSTLKELLTYGIDALNTDDIKSWNDYPWICQYCGTKVSDQSLLREHLKEVHMKCFGFRCVDCDKKNYSFEEFVEHVREHRSSFKYYCQYCNERLEENENIIHINQHHSDHQCSACHENFKNPTELLKHKKLYDRPKVKRRLRKRDPITTEDLTCGICQKVTKSLSNLRTHKRVHTDRRRNFFCDRCGKSFFTKGTLTTHNLIHENPDPQICKICKKSFLTVGRLKKHVQTHYDLKPFQCDECHKCFRLKEQLRGHMITHVDVWPYSCQYCDKMFKFKTVLKNHEVIHTGVRPYSCDVCSMDFTCWSNCNKHMKRKHGTTLAKSKLTPNGKIPIISKSGKLKKIRDIDSEVKEWTDQIMVNRKPGKKVGRDSKQK